MFNTEGQNKIILELKIILNDASHNSNNNKIFQDRKKYNFIFDIFQLFFSLSLSLYCTL